MRMKSHHIENINKGIEIMRKKKQKEILDLKSVMVEMKNLLERLSHRFERAEDRIGRAEDKSTEIFQSEDRKKKNEER